MDELLILSRAVHFGSCLLLLSLFAVRLLVERPADEGRAARRLAGVCLALAAGSGFAWFWVAVAGMNGSGLREALDPRLFAMVLTQTPPGNAWLFRCVAGAGLGVLLPVCRHAWTWRLGAVLAALFTGSLAWLGHAGAGEDGRRAWMLAGDVAHLLAAGIWPAGLLPFALLLRRQMKAGALAAARAATRRFSVVSLVTVAVLALSGVANACFLVGSFQALATSDYGRLLIVKVALFAMAVAFGACNLLIQKPRLETDSRALNAVAVNVWFEIALGTIIVIVVAILGTLPPASHP